MEDISARIAKKYGVGEAGVSENGGPLDTPFKGAVDRTKNAMAELGVVTMSRIQLNADEAKVFRSLTQGIDAGSLHPRTAKSLRSFHQLPDISNGGELVVSPDGARAIEAVMPLLGAPSQTEIDLRSKLQNGESWKEVGE